MALKDEALMAAIERHDVKGIEECLEQGADPNYARSTDAIQPTTPLRLVMSCISDCLLDEGDLKQFAEVARLLLRHGADPGPAMEIAEHRYGKYVADREAGPFMDVWHLIANAKSAVPLLIEFAAGSRFEREPEQAPQPTALCIVGNGPPGSFVRFADGRRVPLPTDQIVSSADAGGAARVGFGGMRFVGLEGALLVFHRVRDLLPESQLSPERGRRMTLAPEMVAAIVVAGQVVWPARH